MEDEINLIDLWQVVWKYRWMTVLLTMIAVVVTGIVSLNLPKQYKATASVLPQIEMSKVQMAVPEAIAGGLLQTQNPMADIVVALLKSERMRQDIVKKFNLQDFYKAEFYEEVLKKLSKATDIKVSKEGVVSVSVVSTDAKLAADIANFYVENLENLNEQLKITLAKPMVTLLDKARVPESKYKPSIKLNIVIAGVVSLFFCIFLSFFIDYCRNIRQQEKEPTISSGTAK